MLIQFVNFASLDISLKPIPALLAMSPLAIDVLLVKFALNVLLDSLWSVSNVNPALILAKHAEHQI